MHPNISVFSGDSLRTYVPRDTSKGGGTEPLYVTYAAVSLVTHILQTASPPKVVVPILGTTKTDRKRMDFAGIFEAKRKTRNVSHLPAHRSPNSGLAELRTRCAVSCRYSPNGEKPRISAKSNIPPLINDTWESFLSQNSICANFTIDQSRCALQRSRFFL